MNAGDTLPVALGLAATQPSNGPHIVTVSGHAAGWRAQGTKSSRDREL